MLTITLLGRQRDVPVSLLFPLSPSHNNMLEMVLCCTERLFLEEAIATVTSGCSWKPWSAVVFRLCDLLMVFQPFYRFISSLCGYQPPVWAETLPCTIWAALCLGERRQLSRVEAMSVWRCEVSSFSFFLGFFWQSCLFLLCLGWRKYEVGLNSEQ